MRAYGLMAGAAVTLLIGASGAPLAAAGGPGSSSIVLVSSSDASGMCPGDGGDGGNGGNGGGNGGGGNGGKGGSGHGGNGGSGHGGDGGNAAVYTDGGQTAVYPKGAPETGGGSVEDIPHGAVVLGLTGLLAATLAGVGAMAEGRGTQR